MGSEMCIRDSAWGLHLDDFNIDLGNLVTLVHDEAAVYSRH